MEAFKLQNGHCNVPLDYTSEYYDLALWVNEQRILYQRSKECIPSQLDEKRIQELEEIGFLWQDNDTTLDSEYNNM